MPNVSFKQGLQSALSTATKVAGAFYLTTDTNRLFYCDGTSFKDLNQYIHSVATRSNLPSPPTDPVADGDFYYIENENILCRYDHTKNPAWVQINPDHNTELQNRTDGLSVSSASNGAQVGMLVTDSKNHEATGSFQILGSSNITVTPDATNGTITITTPDNVNTTYTLSTTSSESQGSINLTGSGNVGTQTVHIVGAANSGITVSDNGSGTISIAGSPSVDSVSNEFDASGNFITTISQGNNEDITSASDNFAPQISYGQSATTAKFLGGTATLDVYKKQEVDNKIAEAIRVADAMTFKGVLGASDALPNTNVRLGDTYKLGADKSGTGKQGDIIIAQGTEGEDGYITASTLTWAVIPSGDEQTLAVANDATIAEFLLTDANTGNDFGGVKFSQDSVSGSSKIGISATNTNNILDVVLAHGNAGTGTAVTLTALDSASTQSSGSTMNIPVITGISKDMHGHITAVTGKTYQVTDTHASMDAISYAVGVASNVATFTMETGLDNAGGRDFQQQISSSSLSIASASVTPDDGVDAAAGISIDLVWGTF